MNTEVYFGWELYTTSASPESRSIHHRSASLPTTYAWPVSSMEEESDSFLDLLRLQAGLLWDTVPNDLRRRESMWRRFSLRRQLSSLNGGRGAKRRLNVKKGLLVT